jgi:hypothetical protein
MYCGDSFHMIRKNEFFTSWLETDSNMHVELGTNAKCGVEGFGIVRFQLELGGYLRVTYVLYVPKLKMNLISF